MTESRPKPIEAVDEAITVIATIPVLTRRPPTLMGRASTSTVCGEAVCGESGLCRSGPAR